MIKDDIMAVVRDYVHHLTLKDYKYERGLGALGESALLEARYVGQFISNYGATIIDPPAHAFGLYSPYAPGMDRQGASVVLWTEEEGGSNIRLDLDVTLSSPHRILGIRIEGCPPKIIPGIQEVVHHLVDHDYSGLADHGHLRRSGLTGQDIEEAVQTYRDRAWEYSSSHVGAFAECTLVDLPTAAFKEALVGYMMGTPGAWVADIRLLWVENCVPSDLTLRMEIDVLDGSVDVHVVGLEVM